MIADTKDIDTREPSAILTFAGRPARTFAFAPASDNQVQKKYKRKILYRN